MLEPYLQDVDVTLYQGDALEVLRQLPAGSVDCCVTSPPYWGLRDYGTGLWDGGNPEHAHETVGARGGRGGSGAPGKQTEGAFPSTLAVDECSCGARRQDRQLGLEPTPDEYITGMVAVFREVRRVLKVTATCWINLGDSYATGTSADRNPTSTEGPNVPASWSNRSQSVRRHPDGLKPKDLAGIPWMLAFALRADGWYLRSDIIWAKPNPMPESVTDRPTKAHEYVFLLSKSPRYFFDQEAVREGYKYDGRKITTVEGKDGSIQHRNGQRWPGIGKASHEARGSLIAHGTDESEPMEISHGGRNIRSVWEISTQPYAEAHFATFPEELVRRCILAGSSERGVCPVCGKPWERETERVDTGVRQKKGDGWATHDGGHGSFHRDGRAKGKGGQAVTALKTLGWRPTCDCEVVHEPSGDHGPWQPSPATVLDPFMGSGTTGLVARKHGRRCIGIELNAEYCGLASRRLAQQSLLTELV